jgi:hypothetical protein
VGRAFLETDISPFGGRNFPAPLRFTNDFVAKPPDISGMGSKPVREALDNMPSRYA